MRFLIITVTFFCMASLSPAFAGQIVSIDDAERLFFENNLDVQAARTALQKADADVFEAAAWPNPVARYSRESVGNGDKTVEETYSLSQNIDLFGARSKHAEAVRKSREAREYFVKRETTGLLVEMKRAYFRVVLLRKNRESLLATSGRFTNTEAKMR